ncbi:hypothetical protein [Microbacterium maritypicum]|uniref:hypothetical protein n=1 Tax=Microbacterium maritypicum TaxID=33918 RepID=UPI00381836BE
MTGMWARWVARRRLVGLGFLTGAAVAIAVAVLLFTLGRGFWSGALVVTATACLVHAGFEFHDATKYARLAK